MPPSDCCAASSRDLDHQGQLHMPRALPHRPLLHRLWHLLRDGSGWMGRLIERGFD